MLIRHRLIAVLSALTVSVLPSSADEAKISGKTITVTGTATVELTPDTVVLSLTVKNASDNAARVADEHVTAVKRTVEMISRMNVPKTDVSTSNMQFGENRVYKQSEWIKQGYVASSELTVTVKDLTQYIPVWKGLAAIEGVSVNSIRFDHSKRIDFITDARKKAVGVAKTKAAMLAEVYGAKIGMPVSIKEESAPDSYYAYAANSQTNRMETSAPEGETGSGGKMQVKARFTVVFELLP